MAVQLGSLGVLPATVGAIRTRPFSTGLGLHLPPASFPSASSSPQSLPGVGCSLGMTLGQAWANLFYFTTHVFNLMGIREKKKPQAISTSKLYFMDITAQVEADWKTSPFLLCLKGMGRNSVDGWQQQGVCWGAGRTHKVGKVRVWDKTPKRLMVPRVLLGSVHD